MPQFTKRFVSAYTTLQVLRRITVKFPISKMQNYYVIRCLVLLVCGVLGGTASTFPVTVSSYFKVSQSNNTFEYRVIQSSQQGSISRCAVACLKEENCSYFNYTQDTRQCQLSNDAIISTKSNLKYFKRSDDSPCYEEGPLGMEDGRIPEESITASSFWRNQTDHRPTKARLHTQTYAAAWCNDEESDNAAPWIQIDFNDIVFVTGLITQGRGGTTNSQWVTEYQVTYSMDTVSWHQVTDVDGSAITFPSNQDRNTLVTTRFPSALRTRILRIKPTAWYMHCSMRFEVIGCCKTNNASVKSI